MNSINVHGPGLSELFPNSSITTSSTKAGILRPGNNRNLSLLNSAPLSNHFAPLIRRQPIVNYRESGNLKNQPNIPMKTVDQIKSTPTVSSRKLNTRTAVASQPRTTPANKKDAIRPFQVNISET